MQGLSQFNISGKLRFKAYRPGTKELLEVTPWTFNKVSQVSGHGVNIIARILAGDNTYPLAITKAKIGTGTATPAVTDTDIQTVTFGNIPVGTATVSGNTVTFEFFIADGDLPYGTYTEFTTHCGLQLFSRALMSPSVTKASPKDYTCEYVFTLTS